MGVQPGVKTGTLWSKNKTDLTKQLGELKLELANLRVQKIAGGASSKLTKMYFPLSPVIGILSQTDTNHQNL